MHVTLACSKVFEGKGGGARPNSSKKKYSQIVKILNMENGCWEHANTYYILKLRFHCEFPDFYLCIYQLPKGGGDTPRIYNFLSVDYKILFAAKIVGGVPHPSLNVMLHAWDFFLSVYKDKKKISSDVHVIFWCNGW